MREIDQWISSSVGSNHWAKVQSRKTWILPPTRCESIHFVFIISVAFSFILIILLHHAFPVREKYRKWRKRASTKVKSSRWGEVECGINRSFLSRWTIYWFSQTSLKFSLPYDYIVGPSLLAPILLQRAFAVLIARTSRGHTSTGRRLNEIARTFRTTLR